jgi:hypothetical protein
MPDLVQIRPAVLELNNADGDKVSPSFYANRA